MLNDIVPLPVKDKIAFALGLLQRVLVLLGLCTDVS